MLSLRRTPFSSITVRSKKIKSKGMRSRGCQERLSNHKHTVRDIFNFGCLARRLVSVQASFAVNEMRSKDCVDQGRFAETGLACKTRQQAKR